MMQNYDFGPNESIRVEANSFAFFWYDPASDMWTGNGNREVVRTIPFSQTFKFPPIVQIGLTLSDTSNAKNSRIWVELVSVSQTSFVVKAKTWADTQLAAVGIDWMAIGHST